MHKLICMLLALAGLLAAQPKPAPLAFEVATIKPADPDSRNVRFMFTPGGGLNAQGVGLKQLISFAYDIPCGRSCDSVISGGPGWIDNERFDVMAKTPAGEAGPAPSPQMSPDARNAFQDQMRERIRTLLAERFQLTIHRETKELSIYALTVSKGGSKLKPAEGDRMGRMRGGRGQLEAENTPLASLAMNLAGITGRPVVDRTGLKGNYSFTLEYTPEMGGPAVPGEATAEAAGSSIFSALQDQLGLKLESTKGPVEIVIIDRAEKPSAN